MTEKPEFPPVEGHDDEGHEPEWRQTEVGCDDCGSHSAIICDVCGEYFDAVVTRGGEAGAVYDLPER